MTRLKTPKSRAIPPLLKHNNFFRRAGLTPLELKPTNIFFPYKENLAAGKGDGNPLRLQLFKRGLWVGSNPGMTAVTICQKQKRVENKARESPLCWQPQSDVYSSTTYTGTMNTTNQGFTCAPWNDESQSLTYFFLQITTTPTKKWKKKNEF